MRIKLVRAGKAFLLIGACAFLGGCPNLTPYAGSVDEHNETGPQRAAAIQISDPQIFARETMLNDRRREAEWLNDLIDKSRTAEFKPQLKRTLETTRAFSGSFTATFDPQRAGDARRADQVNNLQNQIDQKDRQIQLIEQERRLVEAQKRLDKARADTEVKDSGEKVTVDQSKVTDLETQVASLRTQVEDLKKLLAKDPPPKVDDRLPDNGIFRDADITATPQELFRDRLAYREELRSTLAALELDDGHDSFGNSLYRLQFRATVLPGAEKSKFGVARLTVKPPKIDDAEVTQLYKLWLAHVAYRLTGSGQDIARYRTLGAGGELFSTVRFNQFTLVVPPEVQRFAAAVLAPSAAETRTQNQIKSIISGIDNGDYLITKDCVLTARAGDQMQLEKLQKSNLFALAPRSSVPEESQKISDPELFGLIIENADMVSYISAAVRGIGDQSLIQAAGRGVDEKHSVDEMNKLLNYVEDFQGKVGDLRKRARQCEGKIKKDSAVVPARFKSRIHDSETKLAMGGSYVYASTPVEFAQRVSSIASSIESLQLGLLVSAQLQQAGTNLGADLRYLSAARGQVDALERLPVIVGFSDRFECVEDLANCSTQAKRDKQQQSKNSQQKLAQPGSGTPTNAPATGNTATNAPAAGNTPADAPVPSSFRSQFGWIFGPRASLDAEGRDIQLRHIVRNHPLTAELSVPSWWPRVEFELETAWIENWYGNASINPIIQANGSHSPNFRRFIRELPRNRADLDNLTEALATHTIGGALAVTQVTQVRPSTVVRCEGDVTLLVYGSNIWRGSEAFLGGVRHKQLAVLPDMSGLAVTFDTNSLKIAGDGSLVVWTRNGPAESKVAIAGASTCQTQAALAQGRVSKPRYIAATGNDVPVTVTPAIAAYNALELQLRPRPQTGGQISDWVSAGGGVKLGGDGKTLYFSMAKGLFADAKLQNGAVLDSQIALTPRPGAPRTVIPLAPGIVYYADEDAAKAKVVTPSISDLKQEIKITLPNSVREAFDDFDPATTPIEVGIRGEERFKFDIGNRSINGSELKFLLIRLDSEGDEVLRSASRTIGLKFKADDAPQFSEGINLPAKK